MKPNTTLYHECEFLSICEGACKAVSLDSKKPPQTQQQQQKTKTKIPQVWQWQKGFHMDLCAGEMHYSYRNKV